VIARKVASDFSAKNGGTIIGTDHQAPPDWAAFATGCCIRYFDYNDTYLSKEPAHPSDNIAAALAVAESVGANGRELITAIALAYEVQCRLCDAASIRARGWDHPTYGAFSTALAAARLMKLDLEKTRHAVNIAGVNCAAFRQARVGELSHWKGVAFANAARHGVYAALLARAGMTGPAPIFEGAMGFEKELGVSLGQVGDVFDKTKEAMTGGGPASMILKTSIKYWPAEYHSQSAIEAALFLRKEIGDPAQIQSVRIESHDASVDIIGSEPEKWKPETRETADHSLPYITAIALIDGEVTEKQFQPERFTDPTIWKFLEEVTVQRNDELSALYATAVANIVHVTLRDGRVLTKRVDYPLGNALNPVSDQQLEGKFNALVVPEVGEEGARKILAAGWKLDEAKNPTELMKAAKMP
jgi:2-methylcitrate dehydratase